MRTAASANAQYTLGELPVLPPPSDLLATVQFLCVEVPSSSFGRGVARFGIDHAALLECALRLLLLMNQEIHEGLRLRLRVAGAAARLPADLWLDITARADLSLFDAHEEVIGVLRAEPDPGSQLLAAWNLGLLGLTITIWRDSGARDLPDLESMTGDALSLGLRPPRERAGKPCPLAPAPAASRAPGPPT